MTKQKNLLTLMRFYLKAFNKVKGEKLKDHCLRSYIKSRDLREIKIMKDAARELSKVA